MSVSTDGRVVERSLKRSFEHRDILTLVNLQPHPVALVQNNQKTQGQKMTIIRKLAAGLCLDFIDSQSYLVGGDDALVRKSSRSYADQVLLTYSGHLSSIYKVRVNPICKRYFLTASADRTCRVWAVDQTTSLASLRSSTNEHVYAAEWCQFRASIFITGCRDGVVEIWDLNESMTKPQVVISGLKTKEQEETGDGDQKE